MRQLRELKCRRLWRPNDCPIAPKGKTNGYAHGECVCRESLYSGKTVAEWRAEYVRSEPAGAPTVPQQLTLLIGGRS